MPTFRIQENNIDFLRDAIILDTNVLFKAFYTRELNREEARYFLEEVEFQLLIPAAVVVETWGLLVGSRDDWQGGNEFLAWINTPGKTTLIIPQQGSFHNEKALIDRLRGVDCVDAILANLAHNISTQCSLNPAIRVATYDTKDFYAIIGTREYKMNLLDMKSLSDQLFDAS